MTGGLPPSSDGGISSRTASPTLTSRSLPARPRRFRQSKSTPADRRRSSAVAGNHGHDGVGNLDPAIDRGAGQWLVYSHGAGSRPSGGENAQAQLLPAGTTGPLIIDTVGPTVTNVVFARLTGSVYATFQDNLSGLAMASVLNGANYTFYKLVNGRPGQFFPSTITVVQSGGPTAPVQVRISFNGGRYIRGGQYVLTIRSGGVMDVAGNALDGEFSGTFPSGNGTPRGRFRGRSGRPPQHRLRSQADLQRPCLDKESRQGEDAQQGSQPAARRHRPQRQARCQSLLIRTGRGEFLRRAASVKNAHLGADHGITPVMV